MNTKLSLSMAVLVAAGIFALYSAPSFAAATTAGRPTTPPCTVNCGGGGDGGGGGGDITEPGDPFFPPGDDGGPDDGDEPGDEDEGGPDDGDEPGEGGDPGEPGGDPDFPGLTKQEVAELRACIAKLEGLPQVSETQINQFGQPYKVTLTPVCESSRSLTESPVAIVEKGNVYGLEPALKGNEVIKSKLGQSAYKPRDVVGIDFDDKGNAILFVHKKRG